VFLTIVIYRRTTFPFPNAYIIITLSYPLLVDYGCYDPIGRTVNDSCWFPDITDVVICGAFAKTYAGMLQAVMTVPV